MRRWIDNRIVRTVLTAGVYLLLWQIAAAVVARPLLLPGPVLTIRRLFSLLAVPDSYAAIALTLGRVLLGFSLGTVAGVLLGAASGASRFVDALLSPLRSVVKATPVTSFILLALLWFSSGMVPVWIALLMVLPTVWASVLEAVRATDPALLEMAHAFHLSRRQRIREIYAPSALPNVLAACSTAFGFAWKAGVAAEILALPRLAVGSYLYRSKVTLETADLFAWTLCVIVLSMLLERVLVRLMRRIRA